MSVDLQHRLKEIAKECGGNRALCERSGISERTFANWLSGASEPKIIGIAAIAQAAGVTIDWLVHGTTPKSKVGFRTEGGPDIIKIPWIDKKLLNQPLPILQRLRVINHVPFFKGYLKNTLHLSDLNQLCILKMHGDSMKPTFADNDIVLVDRSRSDMSDGIKAFVLEDTITLKRVIHKPNELEVVSDNKAFYPSYTIGRNTVQILGHVVWVGTSVL
ncbi:MAG: S24 family peptidase [Methylocystaceae bacterium]|nr:S24 family peptidase [Methylocystaceae bacterium]